MALFSLFLISTGVSFCHGANFDAKSLQNSVTAQVSKALTARVHRAFESRKPFHLRKVLNEYASGGFIQATGSTDSKCKKTFLSAGFPANMCSGGNDNYFYKIMLSAESDSCTGGIIEYFGDSLCSEYLGTSDLDEGDFSCKRSPNFFSEGDSTFVQYSCSKYAMPTFTVASGVTESYWNSTGCEEGSFSEYVAFTEGSCMDVGIVAFKTTCSDSGALVWEGYATGSNCVGVKIVTKNYPKVCTESDPENSNGDYYYADDDDDRDIFNPPPSVSTTPFPTSMSVMVPTSERHYCAAASTKVIIQASQSVDGISMDIYSANDELYDTTFKQAIAATMTGVTADDFTAFVVAAAADTTTARRLGATFVARVLASDSVEIVYTVTLVTSTSASALVDQLTSAVGDGTFNALLHQFAADNGATALTTATSESVSATDASSSDGGDDSEVLDTGAIIGIAVGGFVVLMIIVVGIYCACARGKSAAVGTV